MATKEQLKELFSTGKKPTGDHFAQLIDESVKSLSNYYTKTNVDNKLNDKADKSELIGYAKSSDLTSKADQSALDALIARVEALEV